MMDFRKYCELTGLGNLRKGDDRLKDFNRGFSGLGQKLSQYLNERRPNFVGPDDHVDSMLTYDAKARFYDTFMSQTRNIGESYVMGQLVSDFVGRRDRPSKNVIDFGCGTGIVTCYVAANNPKTKFYGIDFSSEMIKYANEKKERLGIDNVDFILSDNSRTPFPQGSMDVAYQTRPAWHGNLEDLDNEMYRVLANEGLQMTLQKITKNERSKKYHGVKDGKWHQAEYGGSNLYSKVAFMARRSYLMKGREDSVLLFVGLKSNETN